MATRRSGWRDARWRASQPDRPLSDTLVLPDALRDEIVAHARAEAPKEACGLVAGRGGVASRAIRCANAHPTPVTRYAIDPREQLRAFREMDARGDELVAIYHSHPATQPYPSPTDRAEAHYPDAFFILVSLRTGEPEVRAFRLRGDWVSEAAIVRPGWWGRLSARARAMTRRSPRIR